MLISSSKQITFNLGFVGARISHCSVGGISTAWLKRMIRGWTLIIWRNWLKKMASSPWERERGKSTLDFFPFISKYLPWTFGDRRMYLLHQLLLPLRTIWVIAKKTLYTRCWEPMSHIKNNLSEFWKALRREILMENANLRNGWQYHDNRDETTRTLFITWYR